MVHRVSRQLSLDTEKFKNPFEFAVEQLDNLKHHSVTTSGGTFSDNAVYGGVSMKKADYYEYPCHAEMSSLHSGTEVVWSKWIIPKNAGYEKQSKTYFDWITSDHSPWKFVFELGMSFHNKKYFNQKFWWDNGFIFDRLDVVPSNVMHNFLVASRMPKEWPHAIKLWSELLERGISPEMSMIMATVFFPHGYETANFKCNTNDPYDWPLDAVTGDEEYIKNFLTHYPVEKVFNKPYARSHEYKPVNAIWGQARDPNTGKMKHSNTTYGYDNIKNNVEGSVLAGLYSKDLGKIVANHSQFGGESNKGYVWHCTLEDIATIGLEEEKRFA